MFVRMLPALIWMGILLYASSQSEFPIDTVQVHILTHVGGYSILALLLTIATGIEPRGLVMAGLLAALFSLNDEFRQSFVPERNARFRDVLLNILTATATLAMLALVRNRLARKSQARRPAAAGDHSVGKRGV